MNEVRLINANALKEEIEKRIEQDNAEDFDKGYNIALQGVIELIDNAPAVEERSYEQGVIDGRDTEFDSGFEQGYAKGYENCEHDNERPKGEWIFSQGATTQGSLKCNKCDYRDYHKTNSNFCPNCGADMRGEKNGNQN